MSAGTKVSVVVVAFGNEPTLSKCLAAILASTGVEIELLVVDNGANPAHLECLADYPAALLIGPPLNRGFTGANNEAVGQSTGDIVALVNADAFVEHDALARLAAAASQPDTGIATASVRLADRPHLLNSAGNPVHYSGLSWSGAFEEPAVEHADTTEVASASGAALALRREVWDELGGFNDDMFAYLEDAELSLRCWQCDLAVKYVPDAVVRHQYEFGRHPIKMFLLERNRHLMLLTLYDVRSLVLLAPALLLLEFALFAQALVDGWGGAKVRGWAWIICNGRAIRARRRIVRRSRTVPDRVWMRRLSDRIDPGNVKAPPGMGFLNALLAGHWRLVRPLLRRVT